MLFYTYILYSQSLDLFYKGSTNNIEDRVLRHNKGLESFTSKGIPWNLLWYTKKSSKSEAYRLEMKLKNLSRERLIRFIIKYKDDIIDTKMISILNIRVSNKP
ncbi:GIY-YIG nuclease family protein [Lentimicrobium sp. L6]|nr:GIY-YIG nuclease family protein [Lentimicrobium sp. S6]NPD86969.1 GIY-YIG nuclease family protein [Lentimicrobium sp. L6]